MDGLSSIQYDSVCKNIIYMRSYELAVMNTDMFGIVYTASQRPAFFAD